MKKVIYTAFVAAIVGNLILGFWMGSIYKDQQQDTNSKELVDRLRDSVNSAQYMIRVLQSPSAVIGWDTAVEKTFTGHRYERGAGKQLPIRISPELKPRSRVEIKGMIIDTLYHVTDDSSFRSYMYIMKKKD